MAHDNLKKVQGKQKAYYDRRARSRRLKVFDKMLLLLPTDSNKLLLQWKGPFEVVDYRIDVKGVIGTYHANILTQYVERQSVTRHCLLSIETVAEVD